MFSLNSRFYRIMSKVFDFIGLNVIFILLCLPIVTIGANLTAMHAVMSKMAKKEDLYPFKLFSKTFFGNFKQATIIWAILLGLGGILYMDYQIVMGLGTMESFLLPLIYFFVALLVLSVIFIFPILATFPNSIKVTFKNMFLIMLGFLPYAILCLLIIFAPTFVMIYWYPAYTPYLMYAYMIIGISLTFYVNASFFNRIFNKVIETSQLQSPVERSK